MTAGVFRKLPVEIRAFLWTGENWHDLGKWLEALWQEPRADGKPHQNVLRRPEGLVIRTLEGDMIASVGDWIICGVSGELYPCKPDIFAKTYQRVEAETEPVAHGPGTAVRLAIATALKRELDGQGEAILKEVWENTLTDDQFRLANDELRRVIAWLQGKLTDREQVHVTIEEVDVVAKEPAAPLEHRHQIWRIHVTRTTSAFTGALPGGGTWTELFGSMGAAYAFIRGIKAGLSNRPGIDLRIPASFL